MHDSCQYATAINSQFYSRPTSGNHIVLFDTVKGVSYVIEACPFCPYESSIKPPIWFQHMEEDKCFG